MAYIYESDLYTLPNITKDYNKYDLNKTHPSTLKKYIEIKYKDAIKYLVDETVDIGSIWDLLDDYAYWDPTAHKDVLFADELSKFGYSRHFPSNDVPLDLALYNLLEAKGDIRTACALLGVRGSNALSTIDSIYKATSAPQVNASSKTPASSSPTSSNISPVSFIPQLAGKASDEVIYVQVPVKLSSSTGKLCYAAKTASGVEDFAIAQYTDKFNKVNIPYTLKFNFTIPKTEHANLSQIIGKKVVEALSFLNQKVSNLDSISKNILTQLLSGFKAEVELESQPNQQSMDYQIYNKPNTNEYTLTALGIKSTNLTLSYTGYSLPIKLLAVQRTSSKGGVYRTNYQSVVTYNKFINNKSVQASNKMAAYRLFAGDNIGLPFILNQFYIDSDYTIIATAKQVQTDAIEADTGVLIETKNYSI